MGIDAKGNSFETRSILVSSCTFNLGPRTGHQPCKCLSLTGRQRNTQWNRQLFALHLGFHTFKGPLNARPQSFTCRGTTRGLPHEPQPPSPPPPTTTTIGHPSPTHRPTPQLQWFDGKSSKSPISAATLECHTRKFCLRILFFIRGDHILRNDLETTQDEQRPELSAG